MFVNLVVIMCAPFRAKCDVSERLLLIDNGLWVALSITLLY